MAYKLGSLIFALCLLDCGATQWEVSKYAPIEGNGAMAWLIAQYGWGFMWGMKIALGLLIIAVTKALWQRLYGKCLLSVVAAAYVSVTVVHLILFIKL
jgi:hypothetical protein